MTTHATGKFEIKSWDERPYNEREGAAKITRAGVTQAYSGDIEGEGMVEYLMTYREDGSATYISQERVVGSLGGRSGTFVLQGSGTFDGGTARGTWSVVPGSGSGEMQTLSGGGTYLAKQGESHAEFTFDYDLQ